MLVTGLSAFDKKRYKVYLDEELAFVLYKGELRRFNIRCGESLDQDIYTQIMEEHLPKRAFNRCIHLLEKRDYTSFELKDKLRRAFYPETAIEAGIDKCRNYGYVDDESYVRRYIECYQDRKNKRQLAQSLYKKGIDGHMFQSIYETLDIHTDESKLICHLLEKRHYVEHMTSLEGNREALKKEKNKQLTYLLSKGFAMEGVRRALDITWDSMYN